MQVVARQGEEDDPGEETHRARRYRRCAHHTFNKLKPTYDKVITIVNKEPFMCPQQIKRVKRREAHSHKGTRTNKMPKEKHF